MNDKGLGGIEDSFCGLHWIRAVGYGFSIVC